MAVLVPLSGCDLDTSAIPPPSVSVSVVPAFICAGEEVAVSWDAGEQTDSPHCRPGLVSSGVGHAPSRDECIFVDRSSSPSLALWEDTDDVDSQGTIGVSVTETTTFTAHATVESYEGSGRSFALDASATATVIEETEPPGPTALPFTFVGDCAGATEMWHGVDLKERLSGCLEVLQVCNTGGDIIVLTDIADSTRTDTLAPTDCTEEFNGRGSDLDGRIEGLEATTGSPRCGEEITSGGPPSFGILVRVQCNRDLPSCGF